MVSELESERRKACGGTMSEAIGLGTLVEHTVWGRGKAVEVSSSHVVVHFPSLAGSEQGPRRKLQVTAEQLSVSAVQSDPELDGIPTGPVRVKKPKDGAGGSASRVRPSALPLEHAVVRFRTDYPGLFQDPKLVSEELDYKRRAHATFVELLGEGRGRELLRRCAPGDRGQPREALPKHPHPLPVRDHGGVPWIQGRCGGRSGPGGRPRLRRLACVQHVRGSHGGDREPSHARQGLEGPHVAERDDPPLPRRPLSIHGPQAGGRAADGRPDGLRPPVLRFSEVALLRGAAADERPAARRAERARGHRLHRRADLHVGDEGRWSRGLFSARGR